MSGYQYFFEILRKAQPSSCKIHNEYLAEWQSRGHKICDILG